MIGCLTWFCKAWWTPSSPLKIKLTFKHGGRGSLPGSCNYAKCQNHANSYYVTRHLALHIKWPKWHLWPFRSKLFDYHHKPITVGSGPCASSVPSIWSWFHAVHHLTCLEWWGDRSSDWAYMLQKYLIFLRPLGGLVLRKAFKPRGHSSHTRPPCGTRLHGKYVLYSFYFIFYLILCYFIH